MYTVWFYTQNSVDAHVFISGISDADTAHRIAAELAEEGFVEYAWVEKE